MRVSATVSGVTTPYVWDRLGDVELLVDDGARAYLNLGGLMAEIDSGNTATYLLLDGLGSVRGLTDPNENLIGTADYSVFGEIAGQSGATSRFGFTGEQHDAVTGQLYLRARYLLPGIGRFSAADTVQPNAPGTQGYNRYSYVANNPTTWTDPTGHSAGLAVLALNPAWLPISLAIAAYIIALACSQYPQACLAATFKMVAFIITVLVIMACVLFGFDGACYLTGQMIQTEVRKIPDAVTRADPAPQPRPKPKREIPGPPPTGDRTNRDDKSCRDVANSGEWITQLPSGNPGLEDHLIREGLAPWSSFRGKGRWNQNSWNNLDQLITDAMEGGIVTENPTRHRGDSECAAYFISSVVVGTDGSGNSTSNYVVHFDLDGYIRTTYPEAGGLDGIR